MLHSKKGQYQAEFDLRVVDSPGYGQSIDILEWREKILNEIKRRMKEYRNACK